MICITMKAPSPLSWLEENGNLTFQLSDLSKDHPIRIQYIQDSGNTLYDGVPYNLFFFNGMIVVQVVMQDAQ